MYRYGLGRCNDAAYEGGSGFEMSAGKVSRFFHRRGAESWELGTGNWELGRLAI